MTEQLLSDQLRSSSEPVEIAVRLTKSSINLRKVEQIFFDKQRSEELVEKTNEALMTFVQELKRIKKVLFAAVSIDETEQKAESGDGRQSS